MKQKPRSDLLTIGLAFLGFITLGLSAGLLGLAWPSMVTEFNVRLEDQGILLLPMTVGSLLISFNSGALVHRFGTGRLLLAGNLALALVLAGISLNHSWAIMVGVMFIYGAGGGLIDSVMNGYAAQHHSERVMNWLHACFGIGITITPVIMTAVFAANQSWRLGYIIVSVCYVVVTVLYFLARSRWQDSRPVESDEDAAAPAERISMGTTLRMPIVWIGIGMMFLVAAMETTPGNWIFTLFTEGRGIPEVAAAQWVSVFWGSFTVGRIFFGAIISRVNTQMLVYVCLIGAMAGAGLLWWNSAPWVGYAGLTLLGFAQAPIYPVLTSNTPRRVGRRHAANAIGFQVAAAGAGLSLIPALAGVLAAATSLEAIPPLIFTGTAILLALYQLSVMASAKVKRAEDW